MTLLKTIAAFGLTGLCMIGYVIPGIPAYLLGFLGLRKPMSWVNYRLAQSWAKMLILIAGCSMTVEGRENIPKKGSVCFVGNHVGIFDIVLALAYIGRPFGFIAKKELILVPFINIWILILGGQFIDRKNIRKAVVTIKKGIKTIQNGDGMLIFPEGTRSKGRGLLPFRSGAIKLATNSLAPIVPVAIAGSYEVFEIDGRVHSVPVRMVFCPVIHTAEMNASERKNELADNVRSIIAKTLESPPGSAK